MLNETLKRVGLTEGEVKVYNALIRIGISSLNNIHEKTGLERRSIYDILNKLIEKGMVTYTIEKGKRSFQITHPNKILSYIEEKEYELNNLKKEIKKEISSIIEIYNENKPPIKAEVYRGKEGFKALSEDMLGYKDVWFIGGSGEIQKIMPDFLIFYNKKRIKMKVMWHDLIETNTLMDIFKNKQKKELKKTQYYEYKTLPPEFHSPNIICIFGDKVVNMLWSHSLFAFVIQNKEIADSYLRYFKFLWNAIER
ncbi:MAG: helix-turn-helix domain-containing protein [Nanoarchaeota archaeon]|nr:helix-turn-helix domain-containing protein [Nanoarchaeota archaeon]